MKEGSNDETMLTALSISQPALPHSSQIVSPPHSQESGKKRSVKQARGLLSSQDMHRRLMANESGDLSGGDEIEDLSLIHI